MPNVTQMIRSVSRQKKVHLIEVAKSEWPQQLLPFVPDAPLAEEVLSQVKTLIISVWKENGG